MSDYDKFRYRLKTTGIAVVVSACILAAASISFYNNINEKWRFYSKERAQVYSLHDELVQLLGYGGFIHDFKNLVIRKNITEYEPKMRRDLLTIHKTLDSLSTYEQYNKDSINVIRHTIEQYEGNTDLLVQMINDGASTELIDSRVIVNDGPALYALSLFDEKIKAQVELKTTELSGEFNRAYWVHISSVVLFIFLLFVYLKSLAQANLHQKSLAKKALAGAKAKSDFLANMSHEIRTPMNGVMGMLQLLKKDPKHNNRHQYIDKALFSTKSLLTIINDILDYSKVDANQLKLEDIDFSFDLIVSAVRANIGPLANEKSIDFEIYFPMNLKGKWRGDPARIKQILLNILSNAIKFTDKGSVIMSFEKKRVNKHEGLEIKVNDTGIGMSASAVNRVFERFKQADETITRKYGGTGLGMSITHHLVSLMGGNIDIQSVEGKGSMVTVFLPIEHVDTNVVHSPKTQRIEAPKLSSTSILIVEDNDINMEVVKAMLLDTKATLLFAENGKKAVEIFQTTKLDLIFMDIQMPFMDGIQACGIIREIDPNIPVVALTANVMQQEIDEYLATGFTAHLGKPIDINELYRTLTTLLPSSSANMANAEKQKSHS